MKIDQTIARWSKDVEAFVKNTIAKIPSQDKIKFTAAKEVGNLTNSDAISAFSLNHFPTLDARAMDDYGQYRPRDPDKIWISNRLCREYCRNPADTGWQTLLEATILHELMHWAWRNTPEPPGQDMGEVFEKIIYKRVVTRENR